MVGLGTIIRRQGRDKLTHSVSNQIDGDIEAFDMAIKALEQEPCEDATLKDIFCTGCEYKEQEPKTGHWEWVQYDSNPNIGNWHCSECRETFPVDCSKWNYCPNCGADMRGEE